MDLRRPEMLPDRQSPAPELKHQRQVSAKSAFQSGQHNASQPRAELECRSPDELRLCLPRDKRV
ncbi:hypothetical protein E2C01_048509 [Portunus trituberculatus]|uniref:Uncharacterized protein n=1 Tax=Portunus trituberculatus TaxID=210409 RepID=A0A5B7GB42_PORTR|nr:hypothetical protein [Portunus trituberculatus]